MVASSSLLGGIRVLDSLTAFLLGTPLLVGQGKPPHRERNVSVRESVGARKGMARRVAPWKDDVEGDVRGGKVQSPNPCTGTAQFFSQS